MPTYIVLLGPPGAGKGTQAKIVAARMGLPHISSGEIFRENLKNQTELGILAKGFTDRGELVPDDVTIALIRERLSRPDCRMGALLDGFPRTPVQAEALAEMISGFGGNIASVPFINVSESVLMERLAGRCTCTASGHVFHERLNPPRIVGICDHDGSALYQRDDDKNETVSHRIRVYYEQTMPLIDYYRRKGTLVEIDGSQGIEQVSTELLAVLTQNV
jgi:adenylate kinase